MTLSRTALLVVLVITGFATSCNKRNNSVRLPRIPDVADTATPQQPDTLSGNPVTRVHIQRAVETAINGHCSGFYEALPPGYDSSGIDYPLLVFLHGGGELGNGSTDLPLVLLNAVPKLLHEKKFPVSFKSGDSSFSFIIISPQFNTWPVPDDVQAVVKYATDHYRVNKNRMYVSGLSMGGGATWEHSAKYGAGLAAIVPICGASWPDSVVTRQIASTGIPAWAFHNKDDSVVTALSTTKYVNMINWYRPKTLVRMTIWDTGGHDAWTLATDPAYKEDGKNIYEWMLQYTK